MPFFPIGCPIFCFSQEISGGIFALTTLNADPNPFWLLASGRNGEDVNRSGNATHQVFRLEWIIGKHDVTTPGQLCNFGMQVGNPIPYVAQQNQAAVIGLLDLWPCALNLLLALVSR